MKPGLTDEAMRRSYLLSVLRSRRAVNRILGSVADLVEQDEQCARALLEHPETLAALIRSVTPPGRASSRHMREARPANPAKPLFCAGQVTAPRGRNMKGRSAES